MQINIVNEKEKVFPAKLNSEEEVKEKLSPVELADIGEATNQNIRTEVKNTVIDKKDDKERLNFKKNVEKYSEDLSNVINSNIIKKLEDEGVSSKNSDAELVKKSIDHIIEKREFNREMLKKQREDIKEIVEIAKKIAASGSSDVVRRLENSGMAVTKENVELLKEVSLANDVVKEIDDNTIFQMIKKENPETATNIYLANHSGVAETFKSDDKTWETLSLQAETILSNTGITVNPENMKAAEWLFNHKIEINSVNIAKYLSLNELKENSGTERGITEITENLVKSVSVGNKASDTPIGTANRRQASYIINHIKMLDAKTSINDITARRTIEELRLKLTEESLVKMLNKGIKLDTSNLQEIVESLKNEEDSYYRELLEKTKPIDTDEEEGKASVTGVTENQIELLKSTCTIRSYALTLSFDSNYKIGAISETYKETEITLATYHRAGKAYENGATEIRSDLGDNLKKAFTNIDEVLKSNKLELTDLNRKAVKLLAYNNSEVSTGSVTKMKKAITLTESTLKELKPATVAGLIKSGKNPLDMNMKELLEIAKEINGKVFPEDEKYSHYLYNLEKNGNITQDEREAYIGIYRIITQIEKGDYAAVGAVSLMEQGLNLRNLLSGVRTRKLVGFDQKIDEEFGELVKVLSEDRIDIQIDSAYAKILAGNIKDNLSEEAYQKETEFIKKVQTGEVEKLLNEGADVTVSNLIAQMNITKGRKNLLGLTAEISSDEKDEVNNLSSKFIDEFDELSAIKNENAVNENLNKKIEKLIDRNDITYKDIKNLIGIKRTIALSNTRAEAKRYDIPFIYDKDKLADLSITIKTGRTDLDRGRVAVKLTLDEGEINSEFRIINKRITGYFISDSREILGKLDFNKKVLTENLSSLKVNIGEISYHFESKTLQTTNLDDINNDTLNNTGEAPTSQLYSLGKIITAHVLEITGVKKG